MGISKYLMLAVLLSSGCLYNNNNTKNKVIEILTIIRHKYYLIYTGFIDNTSFYILIFNIIWG